MLRREARAPRLRLLVATGVGLVGVGVGLGVLQISAPPAPRPASSAPCAVAVPVSVPSPVPGPPPAPAPGPGTVDEPIKLIAAASDAPVIAVATTRRVWVSRDGGETFSRALAGDGQISSLVVEPGGRVYAMRVDAWTHRQTSELGILEPDGTERWRQLPDGGIPIDARDGRLVAMAGGGLAIGARAGDAWERVPASRDWNPWRQAMGPDGVARFLATRIGGVDPALYLLAVRAGERARIVWRTPFSDGVGAPSEVTPCAGFAGDRLHLVVRDRRPDPRTQRRAGRLITVHGDGRAEARTLVGRVLDDEGLTCAIGGNDRAAYLSLRTRRTGHQIVRIDVAEPRSVADYTMAFDRIAVDAHGRLLFLAYGRLHRIAESGRSALLLSGSDAQ